MSLSFSLCQNSFELEKKLKSHFSLQAKRHLLVVARFEGLDRLADASKDHLELLRAMHAVGLKWAEKCLGEDKTLVFRLGYHSVCILLLLLQLFVNV